MNLFDPENPPRLTLAHRKGTLSATEIRRRFPQADVGVGLLYLWHDHWEEAHEIAQSREGERHHDMLHGILHRKEGDFSNALYWFRSAGRHPCFPQIAAGVAALSVRHGCPVPSFAQKDWDPAGFVHAVKTPATTPGEGFLRAVQAVEFMTFHAWLRQHESP
ncbi:MAG TPA: hypothetical protein VKZ88_02285 [Fibrobacteria bacterium]|nr:hypothetical protein [Fibrobacteria bacterium]